jgi:hypothetical protein
MKILVKKMRAFGILKAQMIFGAIVMAAAVIAPPIGIAKTDASLLLNPYILGVVAVGMLMFAAFAYFLFIRPYFAYYKSPEVLAQTDGEYLYIYGKKQAKIPLSDLDGAVVTYHLPFIYSKELVAVLLTHLFSENYGDLSLDVPGYGSYRLCFVSDVKAAADELIAFLSAGN